MPADFNSDHVEIEFKSCGSKCSSIELSGDAETKAKAKKRVLDELKKHGLHFSETPYLQVDPDSAVRCLRALRLQAANPGMTFSDASRQVRASDSGRK